MEVNSRRLSQALTRLFLKRPHTSTEHRCSLKRSLSGLSHMQCLRLAPSLKRPHTSFVKENHFDCNTLLGALTRALSNALHESPRALLGGHTRKVLKTPTHDRSLTHTSTHYLSLVLSPSLCIAVRSALQLVNWRDVRVPTLTAWINASTTNRSVRATDVVATSRA